MQVYVSLTSVALCVMMSVSHVTALVTCYSCDTNKTSTCGENFSYNPLVIATCVGNSCTKKFQGVSGHNPHIIRGCSSDTSSYCSSTSVIYEWTTCACMTDLCNTAPGRHVKVDTGMMIISTTGLLGALKYLKIA